MFHYSKMCCSYCFYQLSPRNESDRNIELLKIDRNYNLQLAKKATTDLDISSSQTKPYPILPPTQLPLSPTATSTWTESAS